MEEKIHILHVFNRMNVGGAETMIMNIYRHIDRNKIQFDFLVEEEEPGFYDAEIQRLGGRIFYAGVPKKIGFVSFYKNVYRVLEESGPFNGIHSHIHHFSGVINFIGKKANVPVRISHSHSTSDGSQRHLLRSVYRTIMRKMIHTYSTKLIGCSEEAGQSLFGKKINFEVLPNAINFTDFFEHHPQNLKGELGLPDDSVLVGHIGRFNEVKNHRQLLQIFLAFRLEEKNAHLILVGDGELKEKIQRGISPTDKPFIHFLGLRTDIPSIMSSLDLFLFPSLYEGIPLVLIEAQAAGIPSLISASISRNIALVPDLMHFTSLSESLEKWVQDIKDALLTKRVSKHRRFTLLDAGGYSIQKTLQKLENIYE